jgi:hypothetical protein
MSKALRVELSGLSIPVHVGMIVPVPHSARTAAVSGWDEHSGMVHIKEVSDRGYFMSLFADQLNMTFEEIQHG